METLKEFVIRRLRELDVTERPLRQQLRGIEDEREQLRRAAVAAAIDIESKTLSGSPPPIKAERRTAPEITIKDAVMAVLSSSKRGMTALEILAAINARYSTNYPRTSLSPQLSRLKADKKITRNGSVWELFSEGNEPAHPQPDQEEMRRLLE